MGSIGRGYVITRQSSVLQTPGNPYTRELQCHPFSNSSIPPREWSGMAAFFDGGWGGLQPALRPPPQFFFFNFGWFIYFVTIITRKSQLVDHLMIKTAWGMYLTLYWRWGAIFRLIIFVQIRLINNNFLINFIYFEVLQALTTINETIYHLE